MFSHEERAKAIQLFFLYRYDSIFRLSVGALREWYREYLKSDTINQNKKKRKSKYSEEQKRRAVNHYFEYGQCYARTIKMLGYPCQYLLNRWCEEKAPKARKLRKSAVNLTQNQKQEVVKRFYQPQVNRKSLAEVEGISRESDLPMGRHLSWKGFPTAYVFNKSNRQTIKSHF